MSFRCSHYLDFTSVVFYVIDGDRRQPQSLTLPVKQHWNIHLMWTHLSVPCIWKTSLPEEWSAAWSSVGGETIFLKNLKGELKIFMRAKKGKGNRLVQLWWCNAMKNRAEQQKFFHSLRKIKKIKICSDICLYSRSKILYYSKHAEILRTCYKWNVAIL